MVFRFGCGCLRNLVIVTCHLLGRWSNAFTHLTFQTRINSGILWFCVQSAIFALTEKAIAMLHTASHFFPCCSTNQNANIVLQQHCWHCLFDLIYLWADNMHILYHFMHANALQYENVNRNIEKEKENDNNSAVFCGNRKVDRNNYEIDAMFNIHGTQIVRITCNK